MLDFSHLPNTLNGADIQTFNALGPSDFQTWLRPRGKSMVSILCLSSGAGGGGGFSAAASTARGGGGGGGGGTITRLSHPWSTLISFMSTYHWVALAGPRVLQGLPLAMAQFQQRQTSIRPSTRYLTKPVAWQLAVVLEQPVLLARRVLAPCLQALQVKD